MLTNPCEIEFHPFLQQALAQNGYAALPSANWHWPGSLTTAAEELTVSWGRLEADQFMGDKGKYRYRRYSRFAFDASGRLAPLEGNSIHQLHEHNALNGGITRTYAPLEPQILASPALDYLIRHDATQLGLHPQQDPTRDWVIGVHQVRIVAKDGRLGLPTPEGVHIDAEQYTVQHLLHRENVRGGVFSAYDQNKRPVFHWLQLDRWDSVFFTGSTWHSASPLEVLPGHENGHRDILLIDFEPRQS